METWREIAEGLMGNARLSQQLLEAACPGITYINDLIRRAKVVPSPKILRTWGHGTYEEKK